jgi:hypothetical protein
VIKIIDIKKVRQPACRVMICQLDGSGFNWREKDHLTILLGNDHVGLQLTALLRTATLHSVDLILFPELSVPERFIPELQAWSKEQGGIVVGGSHYVSSEGGYISRCPVIINGQRYDTEKVTPAPAERSPVCPKGLQPGSLTLKFINTAAGNFAVLICADYLNEELKSSLEPDTLDLLLVSAYQNRSELYHRRMSTDTEAAENGIYLLYSNFLAEGADGRSALFGVMDHLYLPRLVQEGLTGSGMPKKLYEFRDGISYMIADLNLEQKRPFQNRTAKTRPNVTIVTDSGGLDTLDVSFSKKIAHDDERYLRIDELYVPPAELPEMIAALDRHRVLFITGDPGMGKTYTAAWLLKHYFKLGYAPVWFTGYEKEERDLQYLELADFDPAPGEVVYIEDPFGRTVFERREALLRLFSPLVEKASRLDCRVIVTSRREIFERFSGEALSPADAVALRTELNVRDPSYDPEQLMLLFHKLAALVSPWYGKTDHEDAVREAISAGRLTTPLAVRELLYASRGISSVDELQESIKRRGRETVQDFSAELLLSQPGTHLALLLVMFGANLNKATLSVLFEKASARLQALNLEVGSFSFATEIRSQLGYRVEQIGQTRTVYRFLHPVYEEALAALAERDTRFGLIAQALTAELAAWDLEVAYVLINRLVLRYPVLTLNIFRDLRKDFGRPADLWVLAPLATKLIDTFYQNGDSAYFELACDCYPLAKAVADLNRDTCPERIFINLLRLVQRYQVNAPTGFDRYFIGRIKWKRIFARSYAIFINFQRFTPILQACAAIEHGTPAIFIRQKGEVLVRRLYLLIEPAYRQQFKKVFRQEPVHETLLRYDQRLAVLEGPEPLDKQTLFRKVTLGDQHYVGKLVIDDGAARAIRSRQNNLLAVGIVAVQGVFVSGDIVGVFDLQGQLMAVGLSEYRSDELRKLMGHISSDFAAILGRAQSAWAIRSDQLLRFQGKDQEQAALWRRR